MKQQRADLEAAEEARRWERLIARLRREAESMGGFGEMTIQIAFHGSAPQSVDLMERRPRYRLDR